MTGVGEELMSSSDPDLLRRAAAGDELAFRALLGRHDATMRAVARRFSDARVEAADIVQEATFSAWRAARTFRGESEVRTWLLGITLNACRRARRRRADEPAVLDPLEGQDLVAPTEEPPPGTVGLLLRLRRGLRELATEDREVIVLRDMVGMSGAETALALQISVAAIHGWRAWRRGRRGDRRTSARMRSVHALRRRSCADSHIASRIAASRLTVLSRIRR